MFNVATKLSIFLLISLIYTKERRHIRFGGLKHLMESNGMLEENPADEMTNVDKGAEEFILFLLCICLYLLYLLYLFVVICNKCNRVIVVGSI